MALIRVIDARNEPLMNLSMALMKKDVFLFDEAEYEHVVAAAGLLKRDGQ